ncbi:MAG: hypothetical protein ABEH43_11100, partial [Flavobacteriales bacterium]
DVGGNNGNEDYWIVKLDNNRNVQWEKNFGGSSAEEANSIVQTVDSGFAVAGYSESSDGDVGGTNGTFDYWILKLDKNGALEWDKTFGGSNGDVANSIVQTTDSGFAVVGNSSSSDGDVGGNNGSRDYWIVKLNNSGVLQWENNLGGSGSDVGESIIQTADSGFAVTGYSESSDGNVGGNNGNDDHWIAKLDNSGTLQWENNHGGSDLERMFSITQTYDGGFAVGGLSRTADGDVGDNNGDFDFWILKLNNNGVLQWENNFGGSNNDRAYNITQTSDSGFVLAGFSRSSDFDVGGNKGKDDHWVVKVTKDSSLQWEKNLGGSDGDQAHSVIHTSDTNTVVAGYSGSSDGDVNVGATDRNDYWVYKLSCNTTASITLTRCDSFTVPSGDETYTTSGTYKDTIPNAVGCDSLITFDLTIDESTDTTFSTTACNEYTVPSGDETYSSSGTYEDTLTNADGCDSIITINLTINDSSSSTINPTACNEYTVPSGDETYTTGGTYKDTVPNAAGCDSMITIDLTINDTSSSTIDTTITCGSYTVPSGDETYLSSGTYMDTIPNSNGCDSLITINLNTGNTDTTINPSVCESYTVPSGDETYITDGTYSDTIPNSAGCDSLITINLSVNNTTSLIDTAVCASYTVPSGDETYKTSGVYSDTLMNATGCDSLITIDLSVNNTDTTISATACNEYTVPSGDENYTTSGTYEDTLMNSFGCDSLITINLTVNDTSSATIDTNTCGPYTVPSGDETYVTSGTYMDTLPNAEGCDSLITINLTTGNTSSTINPTACGSYAVPSGDESYMMSGTYYDTIPNDAGCDSLITINLNSDNTDTTITQTVCDSFTVPSGDETYAMSGTYEDTVANAAGCDSLITIDLTINKSNSDTISETACNEYTVPSGDETYTTSGTYKDTVINSEGCDSLITINLTVNDSSSSTINPITCGSYTVPSGDETYVTDGTYIDTIPNSEGCDSLITINLNTSNTSSTINPSTCGSYTVPSGDETYSVSGTYYDTITNNAGCDSLITINLNSNNTDTSFSRSVCASYTVPSGDETYMTSGTYMDTIPNDAGCDSLITVDLSVNNSSSTINPTACDSYTVPSSDEMYTTSGIYMDTIPNDAGCDSLITINL